MKRLALIFAVLGGPLLADIVLPNGSVIDCYCTDKSGGRVELGQEICLYVDGRAFIARCEMSLNVPMWREIGSGCETSSVSATPPSALDRLRALQPALDTGSIDTKI